MKLVKAIPLPNGTGDEVYAYAMKELVALAVPVFEPMLIVLVVKILVHHAKIRIWAKSFSHNAELPSKSLIQMECNARQWKVIGRLGKLYADWLVNIPMDAS
uniref:Uncharacterized protein LOC105051623 n=2 Tax=Elaeis guineensis var. tenera TaxID=51953 RepID=A0A8N4F2C4_ELAGV|nr:uncharacterized protein LOC105051623 [Elaeis guineensis]